MSKVKRIILCICLFLMPLPVVAAEGQLVPRKVIGIYDNKNEGDPRFTQIHRLLEMPLNHLGFDVVYRDASQEKWPEITDDVYAVVVWLHPDSKIKDADAWLNWLGKVLDQHKKLIILGDLYVSDAFRTSSGGMHKINEVLHRIGVQDTNQWVSVTYDASLLYRDPSMVDFERSYGGNLPAYMGTSAYGDEAKSHLKISSTHHDGIVSDLVITHPNGAYAAQGYILYEQRTSKEEILYWQWYINPFKFLHTVLQDSSIPKPDVTTLNGRRIFYSHMDGDGWNNLTELEEYAGKKILSAEVILEKVIKAYPGLPFTIGITVSEMLKECYGVPKSQAVAQKIFAMPNVEPASHTYSHPLYWGFFADGNADKEKPFLEKYPHPPYERFFVSRWIDEVVSSEKKSHLQDSVISAPARSTNKDPLIGIRTPYITEEEILKDYGIPRSFACDPFDEKKEVDGSINFVNRLAAPKKVKLYQWSGDTKPFESVLRRVRSHGIYNINGGGSRFDTEYPSYTSVSSIGTLVGEERQIYSSNTNENDYTDFWTDRFFGFKFLQTTVTNTEMPVRVHPFNVYFHSYSGQKQASLNALKENLDYAVNLRLAPLSASEYAAIASSFYDTELKQLAPMKWEIKNRNALQTIRFDRATLLSVDFEQSKGVLGQKHFQGSLYIALDPSEDNPIIALNKNNGFVTYAPARNPYLIESNWKINGLQYVNNKLIFSAAGLGMADMLWKQPATGSFMVKVRSKRKTIYKNVLSTDSEGVLRLAFPGNNAPVNVTVTPNPNL